VASLINTHRLPSAAVPGNTICGRESVVAGNLVFAVEEPLFSRSGELVDPASLQLFDSDASVDDLPQS
jgi:hypothetical protein